MKPLGCIKENGLMAKRVLHIFTVIVIGFVFGGIGLVVGAQLGGNFATQFVFNGVQGYEATGQIGFIIGALIGVISSWWFLFKRKS